MGGCRTKRRGGRGDSETQRRRIFCPAIVLLEGWLLGIFRVRTYHIYYLLLGMGAAVFCDLERGCEASDATSCLMIPARCAAEMQGRGPGELILYLSSGDEWF